MRGELLFQVTLADLFELFGQFAPLVTVKMLWPCTKVEKHRSYNNFLVTFMTRPDADRAVMYFSSIRR
jgi:hypothetical protein